MRRYRIGLWRQRARSAARLCYLVSEFELMVDRILRPKDVEAATGLSRTTIWRLVREGTFPAPLRLTGSAPGKGARGWREGDVEKWLESRPRASEPTPANSCATCAELLEVRPLDPEVERWIAEIHADLAWVVATHPSPR